MVGSGALVYVLSYRVADLLSLRRSEMLNVGITVSSIVVGLVMLLLRIHWLSSRQAPPRGFEVLPREDPGAAENCSD